MPRETLAGLALYSLVCLFGALVEIISEPGLLAAPDSDGTTMFSVRAKSISIFSWCLRNFIGRERGC
jgi:hypothetical protein